MVASQVPEDGEVIKTTVIDEVGSTQVITSEMDEAQFLRSQIVEIRRRKDWIASTQRKILRKLRTTDFIRCMR